MTIEVGVEEEREEIVGIEDQDHMIDPAHMIDQVHMIDQRVKRGQIVEIEVGIEMIEVVGIKVEIRVQENKRNNSGTRYSSGLYCDHCKMTNHEILNCKTP